MNGTALKIQQGDCIYISIDAHISTMSIFIAVFYHQSHLSHAIKSLICGKRINRIVYEFNDFLTVSDHFNTNLN